MSTSLSNLFGLRVYVTKCNLELGFLLKFHVVLGLWSKEIERRRKASGLKSEIIRM
jgi:hypothetical protein